MERLSVAQDPCSAVLATVHGCHYEFQKFPFFLCHPVFSGSVHLFSDFLSTRPSVFLSAELNIISTRPHLTVFFFFLGRVSWPVLNFSVERELIVK